MRTKEFLGRIDHGKVVAAIADAEAKSAAQIRVFIQRGPLKGDALPIGEAKFESLGMRHTRDRNAVLIFVAPRAQKFAVIGDEGVHAKCGAEFWQRLIDAMRAHFQQENFTEGLVHAVQGTGKLLAQYFPRTSLSTNELPDEILED